tara:strand:+ start:1424 stop:2035 length:612 start_codon:yes stop_codon:yes gene_type:complete
MKTNATLILGLLIATSMVSAQKMGTMTDPRDNQTYKTATFETALAEFTWMAQNLNFEFQRARDYENNKENRNTLGLFYTWEDAQIVCPKGWHLPSIREWQLLVENLGGEKKAGLALKSKQGWNLNGNGNNSSGFNALPIYPKNNDGKNNKYPSSTYFWSSGGMKGAGHANAFSISYTGYVHNVSKTLGLKLKRNAYPCRCVKD